MKKILIMLCCLISLHVAAQKYVGGDISMLKKFVDEKAIYNDKDGNAVEPLTFFKAQGWNALRVRLFADPTKASSEDKKEGVIQDLEYVKTLGKQIKEAGFKFMLDFHYSDTWTDPGNHSTPSAWSGLSAEQLKTKVYEYTKDCLQQLVAVGATPDLIQTGNEITTGMLWNTGRIYASGGAPAGGSWDNFAAYLTHGIKACHEVCPEAQVIIHTELHAPADVPKFYDNLAKYTDVKYDIIGLSYYPDYHGTMTTFENIITTLEQSHSDKKIMIVETGYGFEWSLVDAKEAYKNQYPLSEAGQKQFTTELIQMLNKHTHVNGLFWWYPEYTLHNIVFKDGKEDWSKNFTSGYWNAALFHYKSGKALAALYELKNFNNGSSGIQNMNAELKSNNVWYSLDGRRMSEESATKGIYIHQGKKIVVR